MSSPRDLLNTVLYESYKSDAKVKKVKKNYNNKNSSSATIASTDEFLWLLSMEELGGYTFKQYRYSLGGSCYSLFKNSNDENACRSLRKLGNNYWLRTRGSDINTNKQDQLYDYFYVNSNGVIECSFTNNVYSLYPGFAI